MLNRECWTRPVPTDFGVFTLTVTRAGLLTLRFPGRPSPWSEQRPRGTAPDFMAAAAAALKSYFAGRKESFRRLPLDLHGRGRFEKEILAALGRVPYGKTVTYGALAGVAGFPGAARAAGSVMKKNPLPLILPCHRVIPASGGSGQYGPGPGWKDRLLELEQTGVFRSGNLPDSGF